jgi:cytochrome c-type biogenesis protein CcmH/NrfG
MPEATDASHAALEEERDFLLRSLDDLESELAEGNVDDATYERLHADYTARAARVLHQLDGDTVAPVETAPGVTPRRRALTIVGLVAFAVLAGIVLAYGLGARLPGQTITGRQSPMATASTKSRLAAARADVHAHPNDAAARLVLARALMSSDPAGALDQFREAARLDPRNAEPYAYSGWLIRLQGFPDQGLTVVDKAISVDAAYPDAHFFRGIILLRDKSDSEAAAAEFRKYLELAPNSPLVAEVRQLLDQATSPSSSASTSPRP